MLTYGHRSKWRTAPLPIAKPFPLRRKQGSRKRKPFKSPVTGDLGALSWSLLSAFYDAAVAVALAAVAALVCGLVAAVVTGGSSPNLPVATIAFVLTGGFMFFRLRRILRESTQ
jgi:fructose-specific phosphotransferase system IIC component